MLHRSRRTCHCVLLSSCSLLPAAVPPEAATDLSLSYATRRAAADDSCCQFMHCLMNQPGTARAAMTVKGVTVSTLPMPATASDGLRISSCLMQVSDTALLCVPKLSYSYRIMDLPLTMNEHACVSRQVTAGWTAIHRQLACCAEMLDSLICCSKEMHAVGKHSSTMHRRVLSIGRQSRASPSSCKSKEDCQGSRQ